MKIRSIWDHPSRTQSPESIRYIVGKSSLGHVLIAFSDKGVVRISVSESRDELLAELENRFPSAEIEPGHREEKAALAAVLASIEDPAQPLDLTLDMRGTAFQKRVWEAVRAIPVGQTRTYADIAKKIGAPKAMRAVGTARANCDFSFAIPCHRVLRSNGTFRGSKDWSEGRQSLLIAREAAAAGGLKKMKSTARSRRAKA